MRVAVFTDADFDRASSLTTALGALLRHAPPDVRPRIYTLSDIDVDEPDYLALRSAALPMGAGSTLHLPRLRELERRLAADGIGAIHLTTSGPAGLTARYLAYRTGLPLVGSVHTSGFPDATSQSAAHRVKLPYLKWLYGACLKVLVPSADGVRRLSNAGWSPDRLAVWPAGVDAEAFSPARRSQRLRNEWHVSDRRLAILCVGALDRTSGLELIEPLGSLLHRQGIAHRFVIVGDGSGQADLQERCPDAVFAGRLSQRDLATVMASADVFLWPGDGARSGLVLLEAQASGLPVVTGDGAARDYVRPDVSALVCHAHSVLGLGLRMAELLTDARRIRAMGEAARRFAQLRSWPASLDRVYALYRGATQPGALGAPPDTRTVPTSRPRRGGPAMTLGITVIVCAHNEERTLPACLHSLLAQTRPPDELLVINNASTDATGAVARQIPNVRVVDEPRKGLVVARETGRTEARGNLLVYVDADCRTPLTWLERVERHFDRDPELVALSGPYRYYDWDWWGRTLVRAYDFTLAPGTQLLVKHVLRLGTIFYGGNFAVRRAALDRIGGFDTSIEFHGEDTNIGRRLFALGKVSLKYDCFLYTSARRYTAMGKGAVFRLYVRNFTSELLYRRPKDTSHVDVRL